MVIPASAAGTPTLSISSGEVKAGESVTLTVSIKDNPGIAAAALYIYYDTETFTVDSENDVNASAKFGGTAAAAVGNYEGRNGMMVVWFNIGDVKKNGEFLTVTLKANKDAANGDHKIEVVPASNNTANMSGELIDVNGGKGILIVADGSDEKIPVSDADAPQFTDISGHWAENYIKQSAGLGLVEGYEGLYRPNDTMTRAEFVTILWRAMGEPKPSKRASFTDLTQDWYLDAVAWAEENNVVNGMGDGLFAPTGSVTREQLVTILHRLAGNPMGMELMLSGIYDDQYSDSGQIGDWAKASLYWSIYEGIYCGENAEEIGSALAPKSPANRAQIAVMMIRYLDKQ